MVHSKSGDHQLRLKGSFIPLFARFVLAPSIRWLALGFLNLPSTVVSATSFFDDAGGWKNSSKKSGDPPGFSFPIVCFLCDLCWSGKWVAQIRLHILHYFFWGWKQLFSGASKKLKPNHGSFQVVEVSNWNEISAEAEKGFPDIFW